MGEASLTIQKWYRAHVTRQKWRDVLEAAASQRRQAEQLRLEYHTKAAKVLQRGIRSSLSVLTCFFLNMF